MSKKGHKFLREYNFMKCLVTGGSGFLGSHVADELTKKGHIVIILI